MLSPPHPTPNNYEPAHKVFPQGSLIGKSLGKSQATGQAESEEDKVSIKKTTSSLLLMSFQYIPFETQIYSCTHVVMEKRKSIST